MPLQLKAMYSNEPPLRCSVIRKSTTAYTVICNLSGMHINWRGIHVLLNKNGDKFPKKAHKYPYNPVNTYAELHIKCRDCGVNDPLNGDAW